ncbi:MAG: hypothetical protein V3W19_18280, partial [Desulfatiglandales bacterium]
GKTVMRVVVDGKLAGAIAVAAGVLYPFVFLPSFLRQLHPILAAFAMAMSSVTVISNSLRLYRAKIK